MTMPTAAAPSSSSPTSRTVLFRRHRNRGGAGGDNDREVPVPMNHEEEEGVSYQNNVDNTQHEAFNNSVDEEVGTSPNRNLHPAIMTNYNSNSNNIPDEEDEEQQELVVQVPRRERRFVAPPPMATDLIDTNPHTTIANNQINHNNTAMPPSSPFGLPSLIGGWTHPSDEVLAIRREAIHREVRHIYCKP